MNSHRRGETTQDRSWPDAEVRGSGGYQDPVAIGPGIRLGGASVPVFGGPRRGADVVHAAVTQLATVRDLVRGPLVVSGMTAADVPSVARIADAVVVGLVAPVGGSSGENDADAVIRGLPSGLVVLIAGDPEAPVGQWRATVQAVRDAGASAVAVVLPAAAAAPSGWPAGSTPAASIRRATGLPVVIDTGADATLVATAVAAGADGIWLDEHADELTVATARDVVARLAPTVRQVTPGTLPDCREAIDRVDAALASLLEYRAGLAARVQRLKPVSGHAGRDAAREAEIVRGMASRAPSLGPDGLHPIVEAIITAGLDAAARERQPDPPVWRL